MDCRPSSPDHHHGDKEVSYDIDVPNLPIHRNVSRSMEDMCRCQMHRTAGVSRRHSQRSLPSILVDLCDCDIESGESKGEPSHKDITINTEEEQISSADKSSQLLSPVLNHKETERNEGRNGLKVRDAGGASGQDKLRYDYVRASKIFQRINNLKRYKESSNSDTLSDDYDSGSGYVIEYQDEEVEHIQGTSNTPDTSQNQYVHLMGTDQRENEPKSYSGFDQEGTPRPPLHLSEHPNVAESDDDSVVDDYEELVIYEELDDRETDDYKEPHYDSIHQMRERTTRLVQGRHRKKLKKFIVKRKSMKQLATSEAKCGSSSDDCSVPDVTMESDSDSSEEEEHVKLITKLEKRSSDISLATAHSGIRTIILPETTEKHKVLQRSHTCKPKRQSQHKSELLDTIQYDQMMQVMLDDHDVKQLQDAGAVKIKDISELRAEIKQLVQSAPSVPPPLPGYGRPGHCKTEDKQCQKKWSSKSLRRVLK